MPPQAHTSPHDRPQRGRGATFNPVNRFEPLAVEPHDDLPREERPALTTQYFIDHSRTIISYNDSPDVGFDAGLNPYRGCEHGCVYCFARPGHEYFGLSAGLDFESQIFVKPAAAKLLRHELSNSRWRPQPIVMSGVTDPYQPVERHLRLTRSCLEVLRDFRNPVALITKNHLVTRDRDLLQAMAAWDGCVVNISLTTLDHRLAGLMEPRASCPADRIRAIEDLSRSGIPVNVMTAPIIPGLNDHEIPRLLQAAAAAGAVSAGYVMLRLPWAVKELFTSWLGTYFPERKNKILNRMRSLRDGDLYQAQFGARMRGRGPVADQVAQLFHITYRRAGFPQRRVRLSAGEFRNPYGEQMMLFSQVKGKREKAKDNSL